MDIALLLYRACSLETGTCYLLASRLRRYADRLGFVNTLLSISVYALVFVMGLRMGANREVTDNLGVIGVQALLVTALTMAFSMLGAFAVRKLCGDHTAGVRERRKYFSCSHRRSLLAVILIIVPYLGDVRNPPRGIIFRASPHNCVCVPRRVFSANSAV